MEKRKLGRQGLETSALGLGCMGMSQSYGVPDEAESLATIDRALELGVGVSASWSWSALPRGPAFTRMPAPWPLPSGTSP